MPNNWGLYDMLGNVWEICLDCKVDKDVGYGIRCGGGWKTVAEWCQSATRSRLPSFIPLSDTGFRIALAPSHPGMIYPEAPVITVPKVDEKEKNFRLAKDAFKAKRYDEAYRLFMKSDLEDREVQYFMGHLYGSGHGVLRNEFEAVKWFRKAAEQGHLSAQVFLGMRYANGQGVVKDEYEAIKWFRKAADLGDVFSFYKLGDMYENGSGVLRDIEEAKKWYRKAAGKGDQNAKKALERLENVRVVSTPQSIQPISLQSQPPSAVASPDQGMVDRPYYMKYCRHCGFSIMHLSKVRRNCTKCGRNLFGN